MRAPPNPVRTNALALILTLGAAALSPAGGAELVAVEPAPAPDLALPDLEGREHSLEAMRGQVVVVNFWASWCAPCRHEMPSLNRAAAALTDEGVAFLALNLGDEPETVRDFVARTPIDFPVLLDLEQATPAHWPIVGLPTTYVIGPAGRMRYRVVGDHEWDAPEVVDALRSLAHPHRGG